MRLHVKTLLLVGATMIVVEAVSLGVAQRLISWSFGALEKRHIEVTTHRAANIVIKRIERIDTSLADWSAWDASYKFVTEGDESFVPENLIPESFVRLDLDIIAMLDVHGEARFAHMLGADKESYDPVPESLMRELRPDGCLSLEKSPKGFQGLFNVPEGTLLICLGPILHSDESGPVGGTLVFARWVNPSLLNTFTDTTLAKVSLDAVRPGQAVPAGIGVEVLGADAVHGSMTLMDVTGRPSVLLGVTTTREIYRQGRRTMNVLLFAMGSITFGYSAVISVLLSSVVLRRIRLLCNQASSVAASGQATHRVTIGGDDELGELAVCMNEMLESIDRSRQAAEAASRAKTDFLANMSHEIRTPMTAILGYADLLMDADQSVEDRTDAVKTIRRNGEHLLAVINDILDVSKIEAGRMTTELIAASPIELAGDVHSMMQARAAEKGIKLILEPCYPLPSTIRTDPLRLRQILVNLVGNATKFTADGSVTIRVSFEPGAQPRIRFDVTDTGIGMSADQVKNLFAPFWQADSSTVRLYGGTGLGLSISQRLARMLGGDILVQSTQGSGSTFSLLIDTGDLTGVEMIERAPMTSDATEAVAVDAGPRSDRPLLGLRVLLAEDGRDNQRLITFHLKRAGAEISCVGDGAMAVTAVTETGADGAFDVILMDMQMPVMDGYSATAELRRRGCVLPIIALTAHAMSSDRAKCLAAGCDEFLTKPLNVAELIHTCRSFANRRHESATKSPVNQRSTI